MEKINDIALRIQFITANIVQLSMASAEIMAICGIEKTEPVDLVP